MGKKKNKVTHTKHNTRFLNPDDKRALLKWIDNGRDNESYPDILKNDENLKNVYDKYSHYSCEKFDLTILVWLLERQRQVFANESTEFAKTPRIIENLNVDTSLHDDPEDEVVSPNETDEYDYGYQTYIIVESNNKETFMSNTIDGQINSIIDSETIIKDCLDEQYPNYDSSKLSEKEQKRIRNECYSTAMNKMEFIKNCIEKLYKIFDNQYERKNYDEQISILNKCKDSILDHLKEKENKELPDVNTFIEKYKQEFTTKKITFNLIERTIFFIRLLKKDEQELFTRCNPTFQQCKKCFNELNDYIDNILSPRIKNCKNTYFFHYIFDFKLTKNRYSEPPFLKQYETKDTILLKQLDDYNEKIRPKFLDSIVAENIYLTSLSSDNYYKYDRLNRLYEAFINEP